MATAEADLEKLKLEKEEDKKEEKKEGKKEKEPKAKKEPKPKQQGEATTSSRTSLTGPVALPAELHPGTLILQRLFSLCLAAFYRGSAAPVGSFCKLPCLSPVLAGGGGGKKEVKKETLLGLSVKKSEDFGKWYSEVSSG